jgi:hypothetical protein
MWEYLQFTVTARQGAPEFWTTENSELGDQSPEWGRALEIYGKDGWELVAFERTDQAAHGPRFLAILKRPLAD